MPEKVSNPKDGSVILGYLINMIKKINMMWYKSLVTDIALLTIFLATIDQVLDCLDKKFRENGMTFFSDLSDEAILN